MLQITLLRRGTPEQVVELREPATLRIGRGAGNEILLHDPDKTVSRTHGEVRREAVGWVFIDNDSQNGSWVEGRRMDRVVLRAGVSVSFGDYELVCSGIATPPGAEDQTRLGVPRPAFEAAAGDVTRAVPPEVGGASPQAVALGPEDQTRLGDASADLEREQLGQGPTAEVPAAVGDDTRPTAPPRMADEDLGDLPTIMSASTDAGPRAKAAAPPAAADADDMAETIVAPFVNGAPVLPVAGSPALAPARPPSLASRPALPEDDEATIAFPVDAEALLRDVKALESLPPVRPGELPTTLAPVPTIGAPALAHGPAPAVGSRSTEEMATVLMPGRPPTGQLATPARRSGETARPELQQPPPPTPSMPIVPVPPPPVQEPPVVTPPPRAAALTPVPVPATGVGPIAAPAPSKAAPPPPAPPPPAPPPVSAQTKARVPAPGAASASSLRPAVFVWGLAWLALFGLVAAGLWLWTSGPTPQPQPPAEQPPAASQSPASPPTTLPTAAPPPASVPAPADTGPVTSPATPAEAPAQPGATVAPTSPGVGAGTPPSGMSPASPSSDAPPVAPTPPGERPTGLPAGSRPPTAAPPPAAGPPIAGVARRPGERPNEYRDRVAGIERQYAAGRQALAAGRVTEARDLLRAVAAAAPSYKDVDGLLQDAEAAVQREAAAGLAMADKQEQAREYDQAIASYRRAERLGAPADQVAAGIQRVQRAMMAVADKAFADARQFDGLGRNADAIRLYQVAVRWLPESDPRRAQAQQRLAVLGTKRP